MKVEDFKRNFWTFDGLIGIAFGLWIGYSLQLEADSGTFLFRSVLTAALIGAFSYFLALFAGFLLSKKFRKIPSWVYISVLGAVFFAFNKYVVLYLIKNWQYRESESVAEYILHFFLGQIISFIFISTYAALPLICVFLGIRLVIYYLKKLEQ